jgi:hypothetical protein
MREKKFKPRHLVFTLVLSMILVGYSNMAWYVLERADGTQVTHRGFIFSLEVASGDKLTLQVPVDASSLKYQMCLRREPILPGAAPERYARANLWSGLYEFEFENAGTVRIVPLFLPCEPWFGKE